MIIVYPEQETHYTTIPVASVIMCAHNHLADLSIPCIESIRRNTYYPYELILVDDGSQDRSIQHFQRMARKAIHLSKRSGVAKARNLGMAAAAGDPIVMIDNDIIVPPEWLTILAEESRKPGVGIVGAVPSNELDRLRAPVSEDGLIELPHVSGFCAAIGRHCFDCIGYFDESLINNGEDTDYCYRARARGFRVANTPRLIVKHLGGGTRRFLPKNEIERSARRFRQKYQEHSKTLPMPPPFPFG